jgi:hypothetical protein
MENHQFNIQIRETDRDKAKQKIEALLFIADRVSTAALLKIKEICKNDPDKLASYLAFLK